MGSCKFKKSLITLFVETCLHGVNSMCMKFGGKISAISTPFKSSNMIFVWNVGLTNITEIHISPHVRSAIKIKTLSADVFFKPNSIISLGCMCILYF